MAVNEILSICAYCVFQLGAARSFRTNGDRLAVRIMLGGIGLDVILSFLPMLGFTAMRSARPVMNAGIITGIAIGCIVWGSFASALIVRIKNKTRLYHVLIATAQILWFVSFVSFLFGMYKFA